MKLIIFAIAISVVFMTDITGPYIEPIEGSEDVDITYATTLNCGQCIMGGFVYCTTAEERVEVAEDETAPSGYCCQDETCSYTSNSAYNCSSSYSDQDYAMHICPFPKGKCGGKHEKMEKEPSDSETEVDIKPMKKGDVCFYKMENKCGGGKIDIEENENVYISVMEFSSNDTDIERDADEGADQASNT